MDLQFTPVMCPSTADLTPLATDPQCNVTEIATAMYPNIIDDRRVQSLFGLIYLCIFTLGVFGNALVCFVVGRNRTMRTVTNFFIANLALSDILLCVLAVPFTPLYTFLRRWTFGSALCHLVPYTQGTSVYISTLTLMSIAVDRYYVILYPFRPRMKTLTCAGVVISVWTFSLLATLPYGIYMRLQPYGEIYFCEETWPLETSRQAFGAVTATLQFVVPFTVIAYCYTMISRRLNAQARARPGCQNAGREEADRGRKKRTNRMLIAMVTIFGVSWMPLNLINLANDVYAPLGNWDYYHLCFFLAHSLAMSSTCYNPFLYAWLNENFRKEFKRVLPCWGGVAGAGGYDGGGPAEGVGGPTSIGCTSAQTLLPPASTVLPDVVVARDDAGVVDAAYCVLEEKVRLRGVATEIVDSVQ